MAMRLGPVGSTQWAVFDTPSLTFFLTRVIGTLYATRAVTVRIPLSSYRW